MEYEFDDLLLDWPLKDLHIICGESHEEINMLVTALTLIVPFGICDLLEQMGRKSINSSIKPIYIYISICRDMEKRMNKCYADS